MINHVILRNQIDNNVYLALKMHLKDGSVLFGRFFAKSCCILVIIESRSDDRKLVRYYGRFVLKERVNHLAGQP